MPSCHAVVTFAVPLKPGVLAILGDGLSRHDLGIEDAFFGGIPSIQPVKNFDKGHDLALGSVRVQLHVYQWCHNHSGQQQGTDGATETKRGRGSEGEGKAYVFATGEQI